MHEVASRRQMQMGNQPLQGMNWLKITSPLILKKLVNLWLTPLQTSCKFSLTMGYYLNTIYIKIQRSNGLWVQLNTIPTHVELCSHVMKRPQPLLQCVDTLSRTKQPTLYISNPILHLVPWRSEKIHNIITFRVKYLKFCNDMHISHTASISYDYRCLELQKIQKRNVCIQCGVN
jgi:hypothetical protein